MNKKYIIIINKYYYYYLLIINNNKIKLYYLRLSLIIKFIIIL